MYLVGNKCNSVIQPKTQKKEVTFWRIKPS